MKTIAQTSLLLSFASLSCTQSINAQAVANKPNVIFILADDLGYGDLGCYGQQTIRTPNIDRLATEGLRFTDFYSGNTVSAPSRCALMTGLHMGHAYIRMNTSGSNGFLRDKDYTMAQMFKEQGYTTGMYGKWGLGFEGSSGAPEKKGFDEFFGYTSQGHAHKYYTDYLVKIVKGRSKQVSVSKKDYSHDLFEQEAINFIRTNHNRPFFLYLPFTIPHASMQIPDKDLLYVDNNGVSIFPEKPFPGAKSYTPQPQPKAVYASMITKMDKTVGILVELLKELGIEQNTLVIFTSDNGPHKEGGIHYEDFDSNGPLRGFKRDFYDGGIRVPFIAWMPGKITPGTSAVPYAFWDVMPTLAEIIGATPPKNLDGISFRENLFGNRNHSTDRALYWEICQKEGVFMQAVREGDWKLIRTIVKDKKQKVELYNLKEDIGETNNVASSNQDIVKHLTAILNSSSTPSGNKAFPWLGDFVK